MEFALKLEKLEYIYISRMDKLWSYIILKSQIAGVAVTKPNLKTSKVTKEGNYTGGYF